MLTSLLPEKLKPFAKAVAPFLVALIAVLGVLIATGEFDRVATSAAVVGLLSTLLVGSTPNAELPVGPNPAGGDVAAELDGLPDAPEGDEDPALRVP